VVADCYLTFGRSDFTGPLRSAEEVRAMSLASLHDEYYTVVRSAHSLV
jgi:hypothetical protein